MTLRLRQLSKLKVVLLAGLICVPVGPSLAADTPKLTEDQKLSAIYAEHLTTSVCKSGYVNNFKTSKLNQSDFQQLNNHMAAACKCLYGQVAQQSSPEDISDYIMNVYAAQKEPNKPNADVTAYFKTQQFQTITKVYNDKAVRKKCGFIK